MTTTNYKQQATDFLTATGTEFKAEFIENGYYFNDDAETRDIYKITLKKGQRKYSFKFGQSLIKSGFYYTMGVAKKTLPLELINKPKQELGFYIKNKINCTFLNNGKSDAIHYPEAPDAYDVLSCLQKYPVYDFADFCAEYGYDEDSRKAYKTYKAVKREWENVAMLYNDEELELLREIN